MAERASFVIDPGQQPTDEARAAAIRLADDWDARAATPWTRWGEGDAAMLTLEFEDTGDPEFAEADRLLSEAATRSGLRFERTLAREPELAGAPFVVVAGKALQAATVDQPALDPAHETFVAATDPLAVDEYFLDRELDEDEGDWVGADRPWEVIDLDEGVLLVSTRIQAELDRLGARGHRVEPVLTADGRTRSERLVQLVPQRWEPTCAEHTDPDLHVRSDRLGDDEVVGILVPERLIALSGRVYETLEGIDAKGLEASEPVFTCEHEEAS